MAEIKLLEDGREYELTRTIFSGHVALDGVLIGSEYYKRTLIQKQDNARMFYDDYEILSLEGVSFGSFITLDTFKTEFKNYVDSQKYPIRSVKRLSDGEVFTLGDIDEKYGKIERFEILDFKPSIYAGCVGTAITSCVEINLLKKLKSKQPTFTTDDGKPYYGDGTIWFVNLIDWTIGFYNPSPNGDITAYYHGRYKYFSTEIAAMKYVFQNKPVSVTFKKFYAEFHELYRVNPSTSPLILFTHLFESYTSGK